MVTLMVMFLGMSSVEISVLPLMGYLVDIRHDGHHGKVYSLWSLFFTLACVVGPVVGGLLTDTGMTYSDKLIDESMTYSRYSDIQ